MNIWLWILYLYFTLWKQHYLGWLVVNSKYSFVRVHGCCRETVASSSKSTNKAAAEGPCRIIKSLQRSDVRAKVIGWLDWFHVSKIWETTCWKWASHTSGGETTSIQPISYNKQKHTQSSLKIFIPMFIMSTYQRKKEMSLFLLFYWSFIWLLSWLRPKIHNREKYSSLLLTELSPYFIYGLFNNADNSSDYTM